MKYFFWTLYPFVEDSVVFSLIENKDKSFGILLCINKQLIKKLKLKIIVSSVEIENSVRLKNKTRMERTMCCHGLHGLE